MKSKGFPHEKVIAWRVRDNLMLSDVGWPPEVIEEQGDLEERIKGQKIFKSGGVRQDWPQRPFENKPERTSRTYTVKSVSGKDVKEYLIEIPLLLSKETGKYKIARPEFITHTCKDDIYGRRVYKKIPRISGPDQHVIAAILFAQQSDDVNKIYGEEFPNDFIELCDKLDKYYRGDFTTVFRREIKYFVWGAYTGCLHALRRFEGKPLKRTLRHRAKYEYKAKIVAEPDAEKGTRLMIKYGKKGKHVLHAPVLYEKFQEAATR